MSKMIPQATIEVLRNFNDTAVNLWGIDCDLYIPTNLDEVLQNDAYAKPSDYTYSHYTTKIWILWSPNAKRLHKMGLFLEGETPIVARFKEEAINDDGESVKTDIIIGSYVKVDIQYVPDKYSNYDEFEIIDLLIGHMHDAVVAKLYKLAPRRVT